MNVLRNSTTKITKICNVCEFYQLVPNRTNAYKSAVSLESLYPKSSLRLVTPSQPESSMSPKFSGFIPIDQLNVSYSRSSGPGGQNVNKLNTKVDLRFHLDSAKWLDEDLKKQLSEKLKSKITKEGFLVYTSDLTRSQQLNVADCLNKLRSNILDATFEAPPPSEESQERFRRRLERAAKERLMQKRIRAETKAQRQAPIDV